MNTPRTLFDLSICAIQELCFEKDWFSSWNIYNQKPYLTALMPQHVIRHLTIQAYEKYKTQIQKIIEELLDLDCQMQTSLYFQIIEPIFRPTNFAQEFQKELCKLVHHYIRLISCPQSNVDTFTSVSFYGRFIELKFYLMTKMAREYTAILVKNECPYLHSEPNCTFCVNRSVKHEWLPKKKPTRSQPECIYYDCHYHEQPCPILFNPNDPDGINIV